MSTLLLQRSLQQERKVPVLNQQRLALLGSITRSAIMAVSSVVSLKRPISIQPGTVPNPGPWTSLLERKPVLDQVE